MILEELVWFFTRLERLRGRPGWLTLIWWERVNVIRAKCARREINYLFSKFFKTACSDYWVLGMHLELLDFYYKPVIKAKCLFSMTLHNFGAEFATQCRYYVLI